MWIPPLPTPFHYRPNGVLYCIPAARIALASLGASGTNVFSSGKHEAIRTKKWRGWNLCCTRTWKWGRGSYPTHKHPVAIKKKKSSKNIRNISTPWLQYTREEGSVLARTLCSDTGCVRVQRSDPSSDYIIVRACCQNEGVCLYSEIAGYGH